MLVVAAVMAHRAPAQGGPATGMVVGEVVDLTTGEPLRRASVCTTHRVGATLEVRRACAAVDSAGWYRLTDLPPGDLTLTLSCPALRGPITHTLATAEVVVVPHGVVVRSWSSRNMGCDPRPVRRLTGTFAGMHVAGHGIEHFSPCETSAWFVPGDSLPPGRDVRRAWVAFSPGAVDAYGASAERASTRRTPVSRWVRWRGTIVGPGRYGPLGSAPFGLTVDSILEVRAALPPDCRLAR